MIIAICGNLGSGKTTLAKYICKSYNFDYIPIRRKELEFLDDFFDNVPEKFLQTQLSFLITKAMQIRKASIEGRNIVIDRSIEEDVNVFAKLWMESYSVDKRVKNLYLDTAHYIIASLPKVDLYILCDCPPYISQERLMNRDKRSFEGKYPDGHIEKLFHYIKQLDFPKESAFIRINSGKWNFTDSSVLDKMLLHIFERLNIESDNQYEQLNIFNIEKCLRIKPEQKYIEEIRVGLNTRKIEINNLKRTVYLAAPFTNQMVKRQVKTDEYFQVLQREQEVLSKAYQKKLEKIKKQLNDFWNVNVILPHKDVNKWGEKDLSSDIILKNIVKNISDSDFIIAIPSNSIGVHLELGIALAQCKPIIIFEVDELENSIYVSNFDVLKGVKRCCANSLNEIPNLLKSRELIHFAEEALEVKKNEIYK